MAAFMFATGIENSIPTIKGGRVRVDEMASCGHYRHWRTDFELVEELGIHFLRYGPPLHTTFRAPDRYDWEFADETFGNLFERELIPIVDLCHFGVPDWMGNFQNPDFPRLFASYARSFAARFPWVQLYTPVNEMFICALFSAKYGWWNEELQSDEAFVTALKNIVKANVLAMSAILEVRPDAIFIQGHSNEATKIIRTIRQMMPGNVTLLGFDQMTTAKFIEESGGPKNLEGMLIRSGFLGELSADPRLKQFAIAYRAKYPNADLLLPMVQYAGMEVLFEALRLAGDNLSREGIRDAFYKVKNFPTILGPVTVQPDGETMSIVNILKMEGGKQVIVKENY